MDVIVGLSFCASVNFRKCLDMMSSPALRLQECGTALIDACIFSVDTFPFSLYRVCIASISEPPEECCNGLNSKPRVERTDPGLGPRLPYMKSRDCIRICAGSL